MKAWRCVLVLGAAWLAGCTYSSEVPVGRDFGLEDFDCQVGSPAIVASVEDPASMHRLRARSGFAYVAAGTNGLAVIDVTDPEAPSLRGTLVHGEGSTTRVDLGATHAFVGAFADIVSVDISDPDAPEEIGFVSPGSGVEGLLVDGNHVFATNHRLYVADVSNPADPAIVDEIDIAGHVAGLDISNGYAFLGNAGQGLQVVDVSHPDAVSQLEGVQFDDRPLEGDETSRRDVAESGGWVFVSGIEGVLFILDATDPTALSLVAELGGFSSILGVVAAGAYVFVADAGSLHIVDASDPASASILHSVPMPGGVQATHVAVSGSHAFVTTDGAGLQIIDLNCAE